MTKEELPYLKVDEFDPQSIKFSKAKQGSDGYKRFFANMKNGKRILIRLPKMFAPYGVSKFPIDKPVDETTSFTLSLSLQDKYKDLKERLEQYDRVLKNYLVNNSKELFGKEYTEEKLDDMEKYNSTVKKAFTKDGEVSEYPDTFKVKLKRNPLKESVNFMSTKDSELLMFDQNNVQLDVDASNVTTSVPSGSEVVCLVELSYISVGTKASSRWTLRQMKVFNNNKEIVGNVLDDDSEEESEEATRPVVSLENLNLGETKAEEVINFEETEVEHEESELDELTPEPEPVKPKRKSAKK